MRVHKSRQLLSRVGVGLLAAATAGPISSYGALDSTGSQIWTQDSPNVLGLAEPGDLFGRALASGDFNCDGIADLAVGAPGDVVDGVDGVGSVTILYGRREIGLSPDGNQSWNPASSPVYSKLQGSFGRTLAAGNINGDYDPTETYECDDLVVGAPSSNLTISGIVAAGEVYILYGSPNGLTVYGAPWNQDSTDSYGSIEGKAEHLDRFGDSLASGDFDCDGYDDIAIGVPLEDVGGMTDAGAVNVIYGSEAGLTTEKNQIIDQDWNTIDEEPEEFDYFGSALASTSRDRSSEGCEPDDLVVGVPGEGFLPIFDLIPGCGWPCAVLSFAFWDEAGLINYLWGGEDGLHVEGRNTGGFSPYDAWHQARDGIKGVAASKEYFGTSVVFGNFDGDDLGVPDLAVGVPGENVVNFKFPFIHINSGALHVFYGTPSHYPDGDRYLTQDSDGIKGGSEYEDRFGGGGILSITGTENTFASGDFDGDGYDDLVIGIPFEDIGSHENSGAVSVIYGSANGIQARDQFWSQNSAGIAGSPEQGDHFGAAVAAGDFNGDGVDDLAVGVPQESTGSAQVHMAGAVHVIYGQGPPRSGEPLNRRPDANAGPDVQVFVGGDCTATVTLDGTTSTDPDGDLINSYVWKIGGETKFGPVQEVTLTKGEHLVSLVVSDGELESESDEATIIAEDTTAPAGDVSFNPGSLWPPNGKMLSVNATVNASDNCDPDVLVALESISPSSGNSGDVSGANFDTDDRSFELRASRPGNIRTNVLYEITYSLADSSENSVLVQGSVSVPHDQRYLIRSAAKETQTKN